MYTLARAILICCLCSSLASELTAQTQIQFFVSRAQNQLSTPDSTFGFQSQIFNSFGIDVLHYKSKQLYLTTGVQYYVFGAKIEEQGGIARYVSENFAIPIGLGLSAFKRKSFSVGAEAILLSAMNFSSTRELIGSNFQTSSILFNSITYHLKIAVPTTFQLKENVSLLLCPHYQRQLNSNSLDFKNTAIGLDLGLSVQLTKPTINQ